MTNPQSALAVIQEKVAALAAPDATMQQIEAQMAGLWNDAEARGDERAIAYLQAAWNHTTMLAQSTSAANAVATAALQAAVEIADSIPDLVEQSFEDGVECAQEGIYESLVNGYNGELYMEEPADEIMETLTFELRRGTFDGPKASDLCTYEDAEQFANYIGGHTPPLGTDLARKVCEFLRDFGAEYRRIIEAQSVEAHARRAELLQQLAENDDAAKKQAS